MKRTPRLLIAAGAVVAALGVATVPASAHSRSSGYHVVYSDDFGSMNGVSAAQSSAAENAHVSPYDTSNSQLQHPTVRSDVTVSGGVLQVATRESTFMTPRGPWYGLTNGRVDIGPTFNLAGHEVLMRLRAVGDGKAANMVWPSRGWPWEVDFAEWFPGSSSATARNHSNLGHGGATHQLISITRVDRSQWHVYGVEFLGNGIRYTVDGHPMQFNENGRVVTTITGAWVPHGSGRIAIGKAVPGPRGRTPLSHFDAVQVDWVQILSH